MAFNSELARLLEHPAIWRGTSVARTDVLSSGFDALDERLPGGGWPRSGLIEILTSRFGVGELTLLLPVLAALTSAPMARLATWVSPPFEPFAPALAAHGVALDRVLVARVPATLRGGTLWAFEQALGSGACDLAMAWSKRPGAKQIRRLQLAAERGRALAVLFRPIQARRESSHATLRVAVVPSTYGVRVNLLKSKGGARGEIELDLTAAAAAERNKRNTALNAHAAAPDLTAAAAAAEQNKRDAALDAHAPETDLTATSRDPGSAGN